MKEKREYVVICLNKEIRQKKEKKKLFEINFTNTFEILQIIHLKIRDTELENSKIHFLEFKFLFSRRNFFVHFF